MMIFMLFHFKSSFPVLINDVDNLISILISYFYTATRALHNFTNNPFAFILPVSINMSSQSYNADADVVMKLASSKGSENGAPATNGDVDDKAARKAAKKAAKLAKKETEAAAAITPIPAPSSHENGHAVVENGESSKSHKKKEKKDKSSKSDKKKEKRKEVESVVQEDEHKSKKSKSKN
jgi:hypothetical protein